MWAYDLDNIIPTCRDFEDKLIKLVWAQRASFVNAGTLASSSYASPSGSDERLTSGLNPSNSNNLNLSLGLSGNVNEKERGQGGVVDEKEVAAIVEQKVESSKRAQNKNKDKDGKKARGCGLNIFSYFVSNREDVEKAAAGPSERPMRLLAPFYAGVATAFSICESHSLVLGLVKDGKADELVGIQSSWAAVRRF